MPGSDVFPGALAPMPDARASAMLTWPPTEPAAPPRFVEGFEPFADVARQAGADPVVLAADLDALWGFIAAHADLLTSPETAEAAARFLGNAIVVAHPAARWRMTSEPEVGTSTRSIPVAGLLRTIVEHPQQRQPFWEMLASWPQADRDAAELADLAHEQAGVELVVTPVPFVRPPFTVQEFLDEDGRVIPYGSRWPDGSPPEEAYSRVSHPERFAPVATVVDALVDHLETWYAVDVDRRRGEAGGRIVQLRPPMGATITLTLTPEAVVIEAGALFRDVAPGCACDACDESAATVADHVEETLLAIAAGGLREVFPVGAQRWVHTRILTPAGHGRSSSGAPDPRLSAARLDDAADRLARLPDGWWPAWPLRSRGA